MKLNVVYIIACLFFTVLALNEALASRRLVSTISKEICDNCDTKNTNPSGEDRPLEEEHKFKTETIDVLAPCNIIVTTPGVYRAPYMAAIHLGILTPPPRQS